MSSGNRGNAQAPGGDMQFCDRGISNGMSRCTNCETGSTRIPQPASPITETALWLAYLPSRVG